MSIHIKRALSKLKRKGTLSSYTVDAIPDDLKIIVNMVCTTSIKSIQCNVFVNRKEDTNNV